VEWVEVWRGMEWEGSGMGRGVRGMECVEG
jgi:hypothetical protein